MHSAEPIEPCVVNDPSHPAGDETWRTEITSRVNSYRARRKSGDESSPALDFGSAGVQCLGMQNLGAQSLGSPSLGGQSAATPSVRGQQGEPRNSALSPRNAFDTNYYRRLNSELMAQYSSGTMSAVATVPEEFEAGPEAPVCAEVCDDLALDLEIRPTVAADSVLDRYRISEPEPAPPSPPLSSAGPMPGAQGNLIVFRRPLLEPPLELQPSRDELAEPVNNRPRILEVPEDIMPAVQGSLFPEIRLDGNEQESSDRREPEFVAPLPVALVAERLIASLADLGVVAAAGLLFASMAWRALPDVPHAKPFWIGLGIATLVLWAVYQYLFLVYAGRTPGMWSRGIRLSTFDGRVPQSMQRRRRTRYIFISFAAVALGFLWAMVDEDKLCWHDRISQTFPTTE